MAHAAKEPGAHPPRSWVLWHPHQRLWNWRLEGMARRVGRPLGLARVLVAALIRVDSLVLLLGIVARRVVRHGPRQALRLVEPSTRRVLYVDCGVHKRGKQLRFVADALGDRCDLALVGVEASAEHHRDALAALADLEHLDLRQVALVGPDHDLAPVRLYRGDHGGKADSLYVETDRYETVPAARLSEILRRDYGECLGDAAVLVRMNIEGSEPDVIDDLVRSGVHRHVDGWFGMWDDVSKQDPDRDRRFRRTLREAGIRSVTFNDRDLGTPWRRRAIRLALDDALRRHPGSTTAR